MWILGVCLQWCAFITCIGLAAMLAYNNVSGWGWFLFLAFIAAAADTYFPNKKGGKVERKQSNDLEP